MFCWVSDEEFWEEEEEALISTSGPPSPPPPPPAPPPPPPPPMAASKMADGISHMSAMAKSKMQAELVAKVKLRQVNLDNTTSTADVLESDVTDATAAAAVLNRIKNIEVRLENDKFVPLPTSKTPATTPCGEAASEDSLLAKTHETAAEKQLPPRRKLYDSLFEERTLSEKERQRRQFLFGLPLSGAKSSVKAPPPAEPKAAPPPPPAKTEAVPKNKDETNRPPTKTVSVKESDEKKPKQNCCVIL